MLLFTLISQIGSGEDDHRMSIDDPRRMSIVSLEDEDSMGLTNIKDLASQSSDENSGVRITDYNTGVFLNFNSFYKSADFREES